MVFRRISSDMKLRALALLQQGWEMDKVVEALNISQRSIERWANNFDEYGCANQPGGLQGRPRTLNATVMAELDDLIRETPSLFLDEIGEWLAIYHDQPISTTALHMNLYDLGLIYKQLRRTAAERDEIARAAWRHDLTTHFIAEQLVFMCNNLLGCRDNIILDFHITAIVSRLRRAQIVNGVVDGVCQSVGVIRQRSLYFSDHPVAFFNVLLDSRVRHDG